MGYRVSGNAFGDDPATGEQLVCAFYTHLLAEDAPESDSWTGPTRIIVSRYRQGPSQSFSQDRIISAQEVTLRRLGSGAVEFLTAGIFADTLAAELDPDIEGYARAAAVLRHATSR